MSIPLNSCLQGSFTSTGGTFVLPVEFSPVYFRMTNLTEQNSTATPGVVKRTEWYAGMPTDSAFTVSNTSGAATDTSAYITSGGITLVNTSLITPGALNTSITAISDANPAVVSLTSTAGIAPGYVAIMSNTTGMLQIGGWAFTVGTVVANTSFTLAYLNSSGFAAAATAGDVRVVPYNPIWYPRNRLITSITQASSAVIQLSVTHGFTVGQLVRIYVPSQFGMTQMNGQLATVTAINTTTNTITVNVNSSGFTAFAFPSSLVAGAGVNFPQVVPVGEAATAPYQNLLDDATNNQSIIGLNIGSAVCGALNDVIEYVAFSGN